MKLRPMIVVVFFATTTWSSCAVSSPLQSGSWFQIARMSDSDLGAFDGDGAFDPNYSFGAFVSSLQSDDFHRPFDVYSGMEILFITGDEQIWGKTSYLELWNEIQSFSNNLFGTNITFEAHISGTDMITAGNILSRSGITEDPWISLVGSHVSGVQNSMIIWGERDYLSPPHNAIKNYHDGINVFVSVPTEVPLPGAALLFSSALGGFWAMNRSRRARTRRRRV